jgi:hypothetical protein
MLATVTDDRSDRIRTSRKMISVPYEKRKELERRLEAEGGLAAQAARELSAGYPRLISDERKPSVVAVLDAWMAEVGEEEFGEELLALREALASDTRRD